MLANATVVRTTGLPPPCYFPRAPKLVLTLVFLIHYNRFTKKNSTQHQPSNKK
jgi:hypothetical protein